MAADPSRLPPGPSAPSVVQLMRFLRDPIGLFESCAERYGPCFTLRLPAYYPVMVVVSEPELLRQVFKGEGLEVLVGKWNTLFAPFSGESSMVCQDGEPHFESRRQLGPHFRGRPMASLDEATCRLAAEQVAGWPEGRVFPLQPEMEAITLKVIWRLIFGGRESEAGERLFSLLPPYLDADASILLKLPLLQRDLGPWSPWGRFLRLRDEVDSLVYALIEEERRAEGEAAPGLLAHLLAQGVEEAQLRDHVMTLFIAGNITTALSLSWTWYRLLRHPEVEAEVRRELAEVVGSEPLSPEHLSSLPYLDGVIKETLRLHPVLPYAFARVLVTPGDLGPYRLPAGAAIVPGIYLTQRREDLWPEATRFSPERFLGAEVSPYHFFPFGGGVRKCIGERFALHEARIILAQILLHTRLRPAFEGPLRVVHKSIMHAPHRGVPVVLAERLQA